MKELPLAVKQAVWINTIGKKYKGKCNTCKVIIDCFCFYVAWDGKFVDLDVLNPICGKCYKTI
jgi:hypothetical protein